MANALSDPSLGKLLQPSKRQSIGIVEPHWETIFIQHTQNKLPLKHLWQSYVNDNGEDHSLRYSAFCSNYRRYTKTLPQDLVDGYLALEWKPGEYVQIDYSGNGIEVVDTNGNRTVAQIFVAVLPYSGYIFAYATADQRRDSWIDALIMLFRHLGGVTSYMLVDNARAVVRKPSKFNPVLNAEFHTFCRYYGIIADAVNPYQPRQKGAVENAVRQVQNCIIKPLAGFRFFSLDEVNLKLETMLRELNNKPMAARAGLSRKELCLREEPHFHELPQLEYELSLQIKTLVVRKDGCIRLGNARYSVPYKHIGKKVEVRILPRLGRVIVCLDGITLAEHELRTPAEPTIYRDVKHLSPSHRFMLLTPKERMQSIAECGANAEKFVTYLHQHVATPLLKRQLQGCLHFMGKLDKPTFNECCRQALESSPVNFEALQAAVSKALAERDSKKEPVVGTNRHRMPNQTSESSFRGADYFRNNQQEKTK